MTPHRQLLAFAFGTALLACSGSDGPAVTETGGTGQPETIDLTGTWSGTWMSRTGVSGSTSTRFQQTGSSISGDTTFTGSPCFAGGTIAGTLAGSAVSSTLSAGSIRVQFDGTVTGNSINGTYQSTAAGACTGDTGTFRMSR